jgi:hypothetical protein
MQELDSALGTADEVIVDGDEQLLSYAVTKASGDPQNEIVVATSDQSGTTGDASTSITSIRIGAAEPPSIYVRNRTTIFVTVLSLLILGVAFVWYLPRGKNWPSPPDCGTIKSGGGIASGGNVSGNSVTINRGGGGGGGSIVSGDGGGPVIRNDGGIKNELPSSSTVISVVQTLSWPAVTIVAILCLFFIARRAIVGGRNVEISWKVTEKVAGRVVITKVRSPPAKAPASKSRSVKEPV